MTEITPQEKLDYIYRRLKREERIERFSFALKWIFRILIIAGLYYFYNFYIPKLIENVKTSFTETVSEGIQNAPSETYESIKSGISNQINNFTGNNSQNSGNTQNSGNNPIY